MRWGNWIGLGLATLALGCSSVALPDGAGGSGAGGSPSGVGGSPSGVGGAIMGVGGVIVVGTGGRIAGTGGAPVGVGGSGVGGTGVGGNSNFAGSCGVPHFNPDSLPGGACFSDCQSVSCGKACTEDCCVPCGIDLSGSKVCTCPTPGAPFDNCACSAPETVPPGLQGGPCNPQGFSTPTVPAGTPATTPSLRGMPCRVTFPLTVCFTQDSTASSERGCICESDGVMHCGSVSHWFVNNGVPTNWLP